MILFPETLSIFALVFVGWSMLGSMPYYHVWSWQQSSEHMHIHSLGKKQKTCRCMECYWKSCDFQISSLLSSSTPKFDIEPNKGTFQVWNFSAFWLQNAPFFLGMCFCSSFHFTWSCKYEMCVYLYLLYIPGSHLSFVLPPKEDLFQSKQGTIGFVYTQMM